MTKNIPIPPNNQVRDRLEQLERRSTASNRRNTEDRRSQDERRFDSRLANVKKPRTIKVWLRSMTRLRLGVDRRKKDDRRFRIDRRQQSLRSLLTREEISDLLSP
jgi:hypothetical protein